MMTPGKMGVADDGRNIHNISDDIENDDGNNMHNVVCINIFVPPFVVQIASAAAKEELNLF